MKKRSIPDLLILCCLFFFQVAELRAQDRIAEILSGSDIQNLTPTQVQDLRNAAQVQGLNIADIMSRARGMGLSADQLMQLQNALPSGTDVNSSTQAQDSEKPSIPSFPSVPKGSSPESVQRIEGLSVFGSSYFRAGNNTLQSVFYIPPPADYQLGPGDQVVIHVWGAAEARYSLELDAGGLVRISGIGPVYLNGLTISDASERLMNQLKRIYSGLEEGADAEQTTFADISLGTVRSMTVSVIGEAVQPGTYTLNSLSTVFNALYVAGGPSANGSYRDIEIIRNNEVIAKLDLYDFLIDANLAGNLRLLNHDFIRVNPYHKHVFLTGEVKRPGVYELIEGETLGDLFNYSAGFTDRAFTKRFVIQRNTDLQRRLENVEWPKDEQIQLKDGDKIKIDQILDRFENRVIVEGAVFKPGAYEWTEGMTVLDLIKKAEGLREDAFLSRSLLSRINNNYQREVISLSLEELISDDAVPSSSDIALQNEDRLTIFSNQDLLENLKIEVNGAVKVPQTISYQSGISLRDVLLMSGGFTYDAANYQVELSRFVTDGDPFIKQNELVESFFFDIDEQFDFGGPPFRLQPYDVITVREQPNNRQLRSVRIEGEVNFPGNYVLRSRSERISDVIKRAGGLSDFAYPEGATFSRPASRVRVDAAELLTDEQVEFRRNDQIGIDLLAILEDPGMDKDLLLESGDRIVIPRLSNIVTVEGEVLYPVNIQFDERLKINDYIDKAGGFTERALNDEIYVIYADGDVDKMRKRWIGRKNPEISPGATIVVPQKEEEERLMPQERIAIYSAIISMAAIVTNTLFQILR